MSNEPQGKIVSSRFRMNRERSSRFVQGWEGDKNSNKKNEKDGRWWENSSCFCFSLLMLFVERKDLLSFAFVTSIGGCRVERVCHRIRRRSNHCARLQRRDARAGSRRSIDGAVWLLAVPEIQQILTNEWNQLSIANTRCQTHAES